MSRRRAILGQKSIFFDLFPGGLIFFEKTSKNFKFCVDGRKSRDYNPPTDDAAVAWSETLLLKSVTPERRRESENLP